MRKLRWPATQLEIETHDIIVIALAESIIERLAAPGWLEPHPDIATAELGSQWWHNHRGFCVHVETKRPYYIGKKAVRYGSTADVGLMGINDMELTFTCNTLGLPCYSIRTELTRPVDPVDWVMAQIELRLLEIRWAIGLVAQGIIFQCQQLKHDRWSGPTPRPIDVREYV